MFTGVIETTGVVEKIIKRRNSISLDVSSKISKDLKIDDSISHNGVCLTITSSNKYSHLVTLVEETLNKSIFKSVSKGDLINLERSLLVGSRLDGHLVQGHVDEVAECIRISENEDSWIFDFKISNKNKNLLVEKGSVSLNGVSLTCYNIKSSTFSISIIPHTYRKTNFGQLKVGDKVNVEFDILGKYLSKTLSKN